MTRPLDPDSPEGIAVAERLTRTLAAIELELSETQSGPPPVGERAAIANAGAESAVDQVGRADE